VYVMHLDTFEATNEGYTAISISYDDWRAFEPNAPVFVGLAP